MKKIITLSLIFLFINKIIVAQSYKIYCGTYTDKNSSSGIYILEYNPITKKIKQLAQTKSANNPSYIAISKNKKLIYAVNETKGGKINVYSINYKKQEIILEQSKSVFGDDPCHIDISTNEKFIVISNYSSGNLIIYQLAKDGYLTSKYQNIQHTNRSVNLERQASAHVHSAYFANYDKQIISADLGEDNIYQYEIIYPTNFVGFNRNAYLSQKLNTRNWLDIKTKNIIKTNGGAGPRHICFSKNYQFMYVVEELSGKVVVYKDEKGIFKKVEEVFLYSNTDTTKANYGSADIHLSEDGKFLYATNRIQENTIIAFKINPTLGTLTKIQSISTQGIKPRNFVVHNNNTDIWIANQNSNNIVLFHRDINTGLLKPTGITYNIPSPVCLKIE